MMQSIRPLFYLLNSNFFFAAWILNGIDILSPQYKVLESKDLISEYLQLSKEQSLL